MGDDFKTVTFRLDHGSCTASSDMSDRLHYGDSLILVFHGVAGIDLTTVTVDMFALTAGTETGMLSGGIPANFAYVSGKRDTVYCPVSLRTTNLKTATDAVVPGTPVTLRLYLADSTKTWLDQTVEVYPSPPAADPTPVNPADRFVTVDQLKALALAVAAMSHLNAAEREARFCALLAGLEAL